MSVSNSIASDPNEAPTAMLKFLREHWQLFLIMVLWLLTGMYLNQAVFALLPLSVFFFKSRELWPEVLFGLLLVLVLSDIEKDMFPMMRVFKNAKNFYVLAIAMIFLLEVKRFAPLSNVFNIFLPFFIYSIFPLVFSNNMVVGLQKTISYWLMFLLVPNYVLYNYRRLGWDFIRNLLFFMVAILLAGFVMQFVDPSLTQIAGRYRGIFGNPNGMAIYCYLTLMLLGVVVSINKGLFSFRERVLLFGSIIYFLIVSGSRASLSAAMIFLVFHRFFAASPFLGLIGLVSLLFVVEVVSSNLEAIIVSLGLEEYFRLETLEDGSGRYFAWYFSWQHVQNYFVFGGGFSNDENIMHRARLFLEKEGHQGGVHNTYLSMWLNVGIVGLLLFLRSFFLLFIKASKLVPMSTAVLFSCLFSIMYESWLMGSLNPYTIVLLMIMTVVTEPEIANWQDFTNADAAEGTEEEATPVPAIAS